MSEVLWEHFLWFFNQFYTWLCQSTALMIDDDTA